MKVTITRSITKGIAIASGILVVIFGLSFVAIRSDFFQRGCHHMPSANWAYTPNCTDAYNGMWFSGGIAVSCSLALCFSMWRLQHV
jgi:hypothetical protein